MLFDFKLETCLRLGSDDRAPYSSPRSLLEGIDIFDEAKPFVAGRQNRRNPRRQSPNRPRRRRSANHPRRHRPTKSPTTLVGKDLILRARRLILRVLQAFLLAKAKAMLGRSRQA